MRVESTCYLQIQMHTQSNQLEKTPVLLLIHAVVSSLFFFLRITIHTRTYCCQRVDVLVYRTERRKVTNLDVIMYYTIIIVIK